ncbi:MAG: NifU N-terminal domain-containing protein [Chloroflexi bacterium]|nr:NifU N-terminal domain-containing protein [Chloroflexota bacterium]MCY4247998.1 NifU N-terminal domain-containing protein [Chloroflexota bacterium]
MSEYVTIEVELGEQPDVVELIVNQLLTADGEETYCNREAGDLGSPLAQMLYAAVDGIDQLTVQEDCLIIRRKPSQPWEAIIDEVRDALRDWYL